MFRQTRGKSYCCRHSCCSRLLLLVLVSGSRYGGVYVMFCIRVGVAKQMAKVLNVIASDVQCACVCELVKTSKDTHTHTHTWRKHNTLAGFNNGVLTSETCWSPYDDVASSHCHLLIPLPPPSFSPYWASYVPSLYINYGFSYFYFCASLFAGDAQEVGNGDLWL